MIIVLAFFLTFEANRSPSGVNDTRWVELRRFSPAGILDSGFYARINTPDATRCSPVLRRNRAGGMDPLWFCNWEGMASDKNWDYQKRDCNTVGCGAWWREPNLRCRCWSGPGGCPTGVLETSPANGVCP